MCAFLINETTGIFDFSAVLKKSIFRTAIGTNVACETSAVIFVAGPNKASTLELTCIARENA